MVHSRERGGTYLGPRQRSRRNIAIVRANDRGLLRNIALRARNRCSPEAKCVLVRCEKGRSDAFRVHGAMSKKNYLTRRRSIDVRRNRFDRGRAFDSAGFIFAHRFFGGEE